LGYRRIAVARAAPAICLLHKRWVFRSFSGRHFAPAAQRSTCQGRGHGADVVIWRKSDKTL